jgi:hypothetical protein
MRKASSVDPKHILGHFNLSLNREPDVFFHENEENPLLSLEGVESFSSVTA